MLSSFFSTTEQCIQAYTQTERRVRRPYLWVELSHLVTGLGEDRREHVTEATPVGIEVDEHELIALYNDKEPCY